jgi:hypothetical protein
LLLVVAICQRTNPALLCTHQRMHACSGVRQVLQRAASLFTEVVTVNHAAFRKRVPVLGEPVRRDFFEVFPVRICEQQTDRQRRQSYRKSVAYPQQ